MLQWCHGNSVLCLHPASHHPRGNNSSARSFAEEDLRDGLDSLAERAWRHVGDVHADRLMTHHLYLIRRLPVQK